MSILDFLKNDEQEEQCIEAVGFAGSSSSWQEALRMARVAIVNPNLTVLITGETGVGKDMLALHIHEASMEHKAGRLPFWSVSCPTLCSDLFEAQLFGVEKGAYTGAHESRGGHVDAAGSGTLYLDEIGDIPMVVQSKLLAFIENRMYHRVGGTSACRFEGRLISATNHRLEKDLREGRFRQDLYQRLNAFQIHLPPLRERLDDVAPIAEALLNKLSEKHDCPKRALSARALALLEKHDFPGNVRELRNLLERSLLQAPPDALFLELDTQSISELTRKTISVVASTRRRLTASENVEYVMIGRIMQEEHNIISRVAQRAGLSRQSLLRRLKKWPELRYYEQGY